MPPHGFGLGRVAPHFPCSNCIVKSSEILETFGFCRLDGWLPGGKKFAS